MANHTTAPQLSFLNSFEAKLTLIMRILRRRDVVAARLGIHERTLRRWLHKDDRFVLPLNEHLAKVDEVYFFCWEKKCMAVERRRRAKAEQPQVHGESDFGIDPIDNC
jgi:hypothetical protein